VDEQGERTRARTVTATVTIDGKKRVITLPLDAEPELPEAEIKARAVEAWHELEAAERSLNAEEVARVQAVLTNNEVFDGLAFFDRLARDASEAVSGNVRLTLDGEPEPDDPPDREAWEAVATQRFHNICTTVLREYAADDAFRSTFARHVLRQAVAWTTAELKASMPRDQLLAMDDEAFHQAFMTRYHEEDFLTSAVALLGAAYFEQAVREIIEALEQDPDLGKKLTDAVRRELAAKDNANRPNTPTPFDPDAITFINDPHTLAALRSIWAGPQAWQRSEHHQPYYQDKNGVTVYAQEGTHFNPQALDAAWRRVLSLDDSKVSTFLICIGKWMADTGGDARGITKTRVDVADILGFRGVKKHHKGGYRRGHKEDARRDILTLNSIWVRSRDTVRDAKGKPKEVQVESRLLEVAIESQQDSSGGFDPYAFRIAPGEWALHYLGPHSRKTADLLRPVMQYDPDKQRLAMRLGIYLASQWRIRAATTNYAQPWAVRTLLQGAFIELPTANYDRFRQQVENALDQLHTDRVIAGWEYVGDADLPLRKWFDLWLDWRVSITPPPISVERYAALAPRRRRAIKHSKQAAAAAQQRKGKA